MNLRDPDIHRAYVFADAAHQAVGQKRKYTQEDYIIHPYEVLQIVSTVEDDLAIGQACLLHDVVEDTKITLRDIEHYFGSQVAEYVGWLTDVAKPSDGNRAVRMQINKAHTAKAPAKVKTVKLADLISNTRSIVAHDKNFARVYLPEKMELLGVLKEGNQKLWQIAYDTCIEGITLLEEDALQEALRP